MPDITLFLVLFNTELGINALSAGQSKRSERIATDSLSLTINSRSNSKESTNNHSMSAKVFRSLSIREWKGRYEQAYLYCW